MNTAWSTAISSRTTSSSALICGRAFWISGCALSLEGGRQAGRRVKVRRSMPRRSRCRANRSRQRRMCSPRQPDVQGADRAAAICGRNCQPGARRPLPPTRAAVPSGSRGGRAGGFAGGLPRVSWRWNRLTARRLLKSHWELGRFLVGEPVRLKPKLYDDLLRRSISEYSSHGPRWESQSIISREERDAPGGCASPACLPTKISLRSLTRGESRPLQTILSGATCWRWSRRC